MTLTHVQQNLNPVQALNRFWGYEQFRCPQLEIVQSLVEQQDVMVLLPTGAGKSICFQVPAVMQSGVTLVVSPLVSLMENQVQELKSRHINAALIHGQQSKRARQNVLSALENLSLRLLYLSPETLLSPVIWELLQRIQSSINTIVVDEAHCLVQWGTTFRPVYRRLGAVRESLGQRSNRLINIATFTATADLKTQIEIRTALQLKHPKVFRQSPYRNNLDLRVKIAWTPRGRRQKLLRFIEQQGDQSGLVYTRSRRDSEALMQWLNLKGYRTKAYHAGLSAADRRDIEQSWLEGCLQFVICTCAFGMGINKPDVRWIAHFQPPLTLSEYVQEIGRAGRDGQRSQVLMLVSEPTGILDPQDRQQRQYFSTQLAEHVRHALKLAQRLPSQGHVPTIIATYPHAEMSLSLLHSMNQLVWIDPMHYRMDRQPSTSLDSIDGDAIHRMAQFVRTRDCRWHYILKAFGFSRQLQEKGCGHCDRCLNRT